MCNHVSVTLAHSHTRAEQMDHHRWYKARVAACEQPPDASVYTRHNRYMVEMCNGLRKKHRTMQWHDLDSAVKIAARLDMPNERPAPFLSVFMEHRSCDVSKPQEFFLRYLATTPELRRMEVDLTDLVDHSVCNLDFYRRRDSRLFLTRVSDQREKWDDVWIRHYWFYEVAVWSLNAVRKELERRKCALHTLVLRRIAIPFTSDNLRLLGTGADSAPFLFWLGVAPFLIGKEQGKLELAVSRKSKRPRDDGESQSAKLQRRE